MSSPDHKTENDYMTVEEAEAVWAILEEVCGARSDHGFVYHQTHEHVTEWRFIGSLGFGGKFWRKSGRYPDGTWGEVWRVDCYREDLTPERVKIIDRANARLRELQASLRFPPAKPECHCWYDGPPCPRHNEDGSER